MSDRQHAPSMSAASWTWLSAAAVVAIVAVGGIVRAFGVLGADFPLNDGGLFYQMVLDLEQTWPALPEVTTYNGIEAPFAYPPLAFYLGAALHGVLGLDVMRVVPVVAATLTIPAFYLLARSLLGHGAYAVAATGAFALVPRSFEWMTMGGGLTRAPGLLAAILALWLTHRMLRGGGWREAVAAGVTGGVVVLTHPQAALFTALSGVLLAAWLVRERAVALRTATALGIALLIALPWLVTLVSRDGAAALISASGTQPGPFIGLLSLLSFQVTGSRLFDVIGLLAAIGLLLSMLRGRWLLAAWLVVVMVLDARGGATYAAIPAAMLAGGAFVDFIFRPFWIQQDQERALPRLGPVRAGLALLLLGVAVINAFGSQLTPTWAAFGLTPEQRAAIGEAGRVAPEGDFLVVSGRFWAIDATAEWFPVLSGAHSVATVQGHEWSDGGEFQRRLGAATALRECVDGGPACIATWSAEWEMDFTHVFVPKGSLEGEFGAPDCCTPLRLLLNASDDYAVVHDAAGGTVYERLDG